MAFLPRGARSRQALESSSYVLDLGLAVLYLEGIGISMGCHLGESNLKN